MDKDYECLDTTATSCVTTVLKNALDRTNDLDHEDSDEGDIYNDLHYPLKTSLNDIIEDNTMLSNKILVPTTAPWLPIQDSFSLTTPVTASGSPSNNNVYTSFETSKEPQFQDVAAIHKHSNYEKACSKQSTTKALLPASYHSDVIETEEEHKEYNLGSENKKDAMGETMIFTQNKHIYETNASDKAKGNFKDSNNVENELFLQPEVLVKPNSDTPTEKTAPILHYNRKRRPSYYFLRAKRHRSVNSASFFFKGEKNLLLSHKTKDISKCNSSSSSPLAPENTAKPSQNIKVTPISCSSMYTAVATKDSDNVSISFPGGRKVIEFSIKLLNENRISNEPACRPQGNLSSIETIIFLTQFFNLRDSCILSQFYSVTDFTWRPSRLWDIKPDEEYDFAPQQQKPATRSRRIMFPSTTASESGSSLIPQAISSNLLKASTNEQICLQKFLKEYKQGKKRIEPETSTCIEQKKEVCINTFEKSYNNTSNNTIGMDCILKRLPCDELVKVFQSLEALDCLSKKSIFCNQLLSNNENAFNGTSASLEKYGILGKALSLLCRWDQSIQFQLLQRPQNDKSSDNVEVYSDTYGCPEKESVKLGISIDTLRLLKAKPYSRLWKNLCMRRNNTNRSKQIRLAPSLFYLDPFLKDVSTTPTTFNNGIPKDNVSNHCVTLMDLKDIYENKDEYDNLAIENEDEIDLLTRPFKKNRIFLKNCNMGGSCYSKPSLSLVASSFEENAKLNDEHLSVIEGTKLNRRPHLTTNLNNYCNDILTKSKSRASKFDSMQNKINEYHSNTTTVNSPQQTSSSSSSSFRRTTSTEAQTAETRRAGRPKVNRAGCRCLLCATYQTPQWRFMNLFNDMWMDLVCNACYMKFNGSRPYSSRNQKTQTLPELALLEKPNRPTFLDYKQKGPCAFPHLMRRTDSKQYSIIKKDSVSKDSCLLTNNDLTVNSNSMADMKEQQPVIGLNKPSDSSVNENANKTIYLNMNKENTCCEFKKTNANNSSKELNKFHNSKNDVYQQLQANSNFTSAKDAPALIRKDDNSKTLSNGIDRDEAGYKTSCILNPNRNENHHTNNSFTHSRTKNNVEKDVEILCNCIDLPTSSFSPAHTKAVILKPELASTVSKHNMNALESLNENMNVAHHQACLKNSFFHPDEESDISNNIIDVTPAFDFNTHLSTQVWKHRHNEQKQTVSFSKAISASYPVNKTEGQYLFSQKLHYCKTNHYSSHFESPVEQPQHF